MKAISPLIFFIITYLATSIVAGDFYKVPITVAFMLTAIFSIAVSKGRLNNRIRIFSRGAGRKNLMLMLWIFILAGAFANSAKEMGCVEAFVNLTLYIVPPDALLAGLFLASALISLSIGTSVGTIVALVPIAVGIADVTSMSVPMLTGIVVGGSFFGDNLSFISDTTIAACNGQGCDMKDKFRENFAIALPAALVTLVLILILSLRANIGAMELKPYNLIQIIPYVLVLLGGLVGVNVFVVLLVGIVSGAVIMLATGAIPATELLSSMGSGAAGMFETTMVAILVAAICALIREHGGFEALLNGILKVFKGRKGGQLGMGLLVGAMDIATANNTVAIVMANPIAAQMAERYGISKRKTASLLDTFSCVFQGIIPYGAQMLVALSAANEMGHGVSAFEVIPNLFYPFLLLLSSLVFIYLIPEKKAK